MKVQINDTIINVDVEFSKRKKIQVSMDCLGLVKVKAPKGTDEAVIQDIITKNAKVILKNKEKVNQRLNAPKKREYTDDELFLLLGKPHALCELIDIDGMNDEQVRDALKKFYFAKCRQIVNERVKKYQGELKVKPKSVSIEQSKTKWGSCSSAKNLMFNYTLAMAPIELIDYVVVHELCHIIHMNHDRSFWRLVGKIVPDYKDKITKLAMYEKYMNY